MSISPYKAVFFTLLGPYHCLAQYKFISLLIICLEAADFIFLILKTDKQNYKHQRLSSWDKHSLDLRISQPLELFDFLGLILFLEGNDIEAISFTFRGPPPSPGADHAAAVYAGHYLCIFGDGSHSSCFSDSHFELENGHASTAIGDLCNNFGGWHLCMFQLFMYHDQYHGFRK
ncbi:hypothetical protein SELMODRAFT_406990 [Selaginella moellendorffii]|uniref:Uncharacterized protein n=1 Tax=Selaginella moellendorffii TaxID=88036 RepID=D8R3K1_SELML|nr:hypothetical protein SELMODRAFT_406990 [Selaginella moellendorffii]